MTKIDWDKALEVEESAGGRSRTYPAQLRCTIKRHGRPPQRFVTCEIDEGNEFGALFENSGTPVDDQRLQIRNTPPASKTLGYVGAAPVRVKKGKTDGY